jgi:hypothetical protein
VIVRCIGAQIVRLTPYESEERREKLRTHFLLAEEADHESKSTVSPRREKGNLRSIVVVRERQREKQRGRQRVRETEREGEESDILTGW